MSKLLGDLEIAREYTTGQVRTLDLLMMSSRHSCEGCHALCPELILVVDVLPSCEGFWARFFLLDRSAVCNPFAVAVKTGTLCPEVTLACARLASILVVDNLVP